jgi:hypothetical protein
MIVYQAETGEILPIQFTNEITSQDELVQKIEQITRIPIQFQIILTSDGSQYRQGIQKELFLFNRQSLDQVEGVMKMSIDIEPPPSITNLISRFRNNRTYNDRKAKIGFSIA